MYKRKIFELFTGFLVRIFAKANKFNTSLLERMRPISKVKTSSGEMKFFCPNFLTLWRAKTFFTKEPDTVKWIDSFVAGDVFYDIGANVGIYTIYAGLKGANVLAFEPESQNYGLLNNNIYINRQDDSITAYNIALSNGSRFSNLNISEFIAGGALNNFDQEVDFNKNKLSLSFKQGAISFSLDDLIEKHGFNVPNHIKIDVDGAEREIIDGALNTLKKNRG